MTSHLNPRKFRTSIFIPVVALACLVLAGCSTLRSATAATSVQHFDAVKVVQYPWGWIRWMMNAELDPQATQTLGIVQIEAGQRNPFHKHPNCEELLYVLSGTLEHVAGNERVVLHAGDTIRIPAGVPHQGFNRTKEPVRTVVTYNTGTRTMVTLDPPAK